MPSGTAGRRSACGSGSARAGSCAGSTTTGPASTTRSPATGRRTATTCPAAAWGCGSPGNCATTSTSRGTTTASTSASRSVWAERLPSAGSAEEVAEEGLLLPPVGRPGGGPPTLDLAQHVADHRTEAGARRCRRARGRLVVGPLRPRGLPSGRAVAVPCGLRVDEPVQLATVEEDAAAVRALVDVHAVAFVGPHGAMTLGAGQLHARATEAWDHEFPARWVRGPFPPVVGARRFLEGRRRYWETADLTDGST